MLSGYRAYARLLGIPHHSGKNKTWKNHERQTAKDLGTQRQPSNGRRAADILTDRFFIEHKQRKTVPEWWKKAIEQLKPCPPHQIPLLVFALAPGVPGVKVQKYAILRWQDFLELLREQEDRSLISETDYKRLTSATDTITPEG